MSGIKRLNIDWTYQEMDPHPEGELVYFDDHEEETARLRAELDNAAAAAVANMSLACEKEREADALRVDAMRYRWLTDPNFGQLSISDLFNAWWRSENGHPETINDAIDLAMKQDDAAMGADA